MRDPHVVVLIYRLVTDERTQFDSVQPIEEETDMFHLRLENGTAIFEFKEHFPSPDLARVEIEPYLRAWELDDALRQGRRTIQFNYETAEVIDRDPIPSKSNIDKLIFAGEVIAVGELAIVHIRRGEYPRPPQTFKVTPDVQTLWGRYEGYLNKHEPLPAMAYFCVTLIENNAGGLAKAAELYRVSRNVLEKLKALSSYRGDEMTARKKDKNVQMKPLGTSEVVWMECVIKAIILRVGDPSLPKIDMTDLPPLTE